MKMLTNVKMRIGLGLTLLALSVSPALSATNYTKNNEPNDVVPLAKKRSYIYSGLPQGGLLDTGHFISDGKVWIWGYIGSGQSGNGYITPTFSSVAKPVEGIKNVVSTAGGIHHMLAIDANGDLWAWGYAVQGSTGCGNFGVGGATKYPCKVLSDVVQVAAGEYLSIALTRSGDVYTWGSNLYGVVGVGQGTVPTYVNTPQHINKHLNNEKAIMIGGTYEHAYAITVNGSWKRTLWGWGDSEAGALGIPTTPCIGVKVVWYPTKMTNLDAYLDRIVSISGGNMWGTALLDNGDVIGWGHGYSLGIGENNITKCSTTPVYILKGQNVEHMYARYRGGIALTSDNKIYTWGYTGGSGDPHDLIYGRTVTHRSNVNGKPVAVGGGKEHIYYVNEEGKLYGVGYNAGGQIYPPNKAIRQWPGAEVPVTDWIGQYQP